MPDYAKLPIGPRALRCSPVLLLSFPDFFLLFLRASVAPCLRGGFSTLVSFAPLAAIHSLIAAPFPHFPPQFTALHRNGALTWVNSIAKVAVTLKVQPVFLLLWKTRGQNSRSKPK